MTKGPERRHPAGAELVGDGVSFRVWAPSAAAVAVVVDGASHRLAADRDGYFEATVRGVGAGAAYGFRLDDDAAVLPDPASRCQPEGPSGLSLVFDPDAFRWTDAAWPGVTMEGQVIYEMHVGTFTPEGTWAAAAAKLPFLKDVGVTVVEMMPVNEFPGRFGWGYDGVNLFAPTRLYGTPDDLRAFVDRAHALGLGVILDVVYNHIGPDGNHLPRFSKDYFTDRHGTEWGEALNFDGPNAVGMRDFVVSNAAYWIEDYRFDGLRLDATQAIFDSSDEHVIKALARAARAAAGTRNIILVAENEPQHTELARPVAEGGFGLDGLWNDDLHHSAMVAVTGHNEAYYQDHDGTPQELISAAKHGYLFQGQLYASSGKRRGTPSLDLSPAAFVTFVQNHDQIANSARGYRLQQLTSPGRARAITALILLMPGTPMLFQGQEFWASAPFRFFADHRPDLAKLVRVGRGQFLAQFASLASEAAQARLPDPESPDTFAACKLDWAEAEANRHVVAMHRDLLRLRARDGAFSTGARLDGAVLGTEAFLLRFFADNGDDRVLVVNLGRDIKRRSLAEPLIAPPHGRRWSVLWSSEDPAYGGSDTPPFEMDDGLHIPGQAAIVLGLEPQTGPDPRKPGEP